MVDEKILEAIKDDETETVETPVEQNTTEQVPEEQPKVEQVNTQTEQAPVEKTYSQSDWDKMVYSLRKQIGKQKDKYTEQIIPQTIPDII